MKTDSAALAVIERNQQQLRQPLCLVGAPGSLPRHESCDVSIVTLDQGDWQHHGGRECGWFLGYDDADIPESFNSIVIFMPKAKAELAMRCSWAAARLAEGGDLWLVGERRAGIAGGARWFRDFFPGAYKVDSARHCQLWKAGWNANQGNKGFRTRDWFSRRHVTIAGQPLMLADLPGVFSEGRTDPGTQMLLSTINERPREPVLDFGCGNGVIGAWLMQRWPELALTLSDVQWQALNCARETLGDRGNVRIVASDGLGALTPGYGTILSNPPFHQGVETDATVAQTLIHKAAEFLLPGGELRLVANAFLPYPRDLRESFQEPAILADDGRYRVYRVQKLNHSRAK